MEAVVGKTASINLVDGLPRMGEGVGGASFSCSMEAVVGDAAAIVLLVGLSLGIGETASIDFLDGLCTVGIRGALDWISLGTGSSCIACPLSRISLPAACETGGEAARDSG